MNEKTDEDTIVPVTTQMLVDSLRQSEDDVIKIDGVPISKFELVAKIENIQEMDNQFVLTLGDGFGVIKVMCIKVFNETKPGSL